MTRGAQVAGVAVGALAIGAAVAAQPSIAALMAIGVVLALGSALVDLRVWTAVVLGVCLTLPFDYLRPTAGVFRGAPTLAILVVALALLARSKTRGGSRVLRESWDTWLLVGWVAIVVVISGDYGGFRELFLWVCAAALFTAVVANRDISPKEFAQLAIVLLIGVGAFQGALAVAEKALGAESVYRLLPGYAPIVRSLGMGYGTRAVAFAGHALRLGTLEMLAVLSAIGALMESSPRRSLVALALPVCLAGLILSGARGAWLGTMVGIAVMLVLNVKHRGPSRGLSAAAIATVAVGALGLSPVGRFVLDRVSGGASEASSIGQRLAVLSVSAGVVARSPVVGHGYRQADAALYGAGLVIPNVENEYIAALIIGGVPLLVLLITVLVRSALMSRASSRSQSFVPVALLCAMVVNIGTYNTLTWSFGPAILLLTAAVARRQGA